MIFVALEYFILMTLTGYLNEKCIQRLGESQARCAKKNKAEA